MNAKPARTVYDYLFCALVGPLYLYAVNGAIIETTILQVTPARLFITGLLLFALWMVIFYSKKSFLFALGAVAVIALYLWLTVASWEDTLEFLTEIFYALRGLTPLKDAHHLAVITALCAATALVTSLFLYVRFSFLVVSAGGGAVFALGWVMRYKREDFLFLVFLLCVFMLLIRRMNTGKKSRYGSLNALLALPLCVTALVVASYLPSPAGGAASSISRFMAKPMEAVNDFFYAAFNPKYFSFQSTGFSGADNKLGGAVTLNARQIMRVDTRRPVYLSGAVKDTYTGESWANTFEQPMPTAGYSPGYFEYLETGAALTRTLSAQYALTYDTVTVTVLSPTGSLFSPAKAFDPYMAQENGAEIPSISVTPAGEWRAENLLDRGAAYSFEYLAFNADNYVVSTYILKRTYKGFYEDTRDVYSNVLGLYANEVYKRYTGLPETLPQRVYDLADELTSGLSANGPASDYDKVKAIEAYLLTFPYTLSPAGIPEGADFADYFLFEGKEGYCTYYATAMAVLARCAGVPSRYMEGFIVTGASPQNSSVVVTNSNAHAWAEVYLEGYGWLRLEPTAPYNGIANGGASYIPPGTLAESYVNEPDYLEHLRNMGYTDEAINEYAMPTPQPRAEKPPFEFTGMTSLYMMLAAAGLAALGFLFIGVQRLREKARLKKIGKMTANEQARVYFKGLIKITSYYHYPMGEDETSQMYGNRLRKRFAFKSDTVFLADLIKIYYKAAYGQFQISEAELALLRDCYNEMVLFIKMVRGGPRYFFIRYVRRVTAL